MNGRGATPGGRLRASLRLALGIGAGLVVAPGVPATAPLASSLSAQEAREDAAREERWAEEREELVRLVADPPHGLPPVEDEAVLRALRRVPRHEFVPPPLRDQSYADHPLPIGHGQTISQPSLVAHMTALLELQRGEKVLEIGTGSGYQAAILAEITDSVFTIEIVPELARTARERLRGLGYRSVRVRHGDGYRGWPEHAPFDAIVVTAAPEEIPPPLEEQLAPGGRMVIPRGPVGRTQTLVLVRRTEEGRLRRRELYPVRFVPFLRDTGGAAGAAGGAPR